MPTREVRFLGPEDERYVPGTDVVVQRGHKVEVDSDLARSLLEQGNWEAVKDPARVRAAKKAATTRAADEAVDTEPESPTESAASDTAPEE